MSLHCLDRYVFLLTWESFIFFLFIQILNQQGFYSRNMLALKKTKTKPNHHQPFYPRKL